MGTKKVAIIVDDEDMLNLQNAANTILKYSSEHHEDCIEVYTVAGLAKKIEQEIEAGHFEEHGI